MATTILTHDQDDVDSATSSPKSKRRTARRNTAMGLVAAALTLLGLAVAAPSASAATTYSVNMSQACKYTYNNPSLFADYGNYWNPFSWYCVSWSVTVSVPPSFTYTPIGGVDVQKYCSITYPGSRAVIVSWNVSGWRCQR